MYYDVCEDPEELQSMVHTGIHQADPPAVSQLKRRLQTLETKRGNICARRAYLRNKKVCASAADMKSFHILWSFVFFKCFGDFLSKEKCIDPSKAHLRLPRVPNAGFLKCFYYIGLFLADIVIEALGMFSSFVGCLLI